MIKCTLTLISFFYILTSFSQYSTPGEAFLKGLQMSRTPVRTAHAGDDMQSLNILNDFTKLPKELYNNRIYRDSLLNSISDSIIISKYISGYDAIRKCVNRKCKMFYLEEIIERKHLCVTIMKQNQK